MAGSAAILLRQGGKRDVHLLRDLVRHTGLERSGLPIDEEPPPLSRYVAGWGRPGDTAVVAIDEHAHVPVGAAWFRLFRAGEAGWGFIDEETPEVTVAVLPGRRGEGIGEQLLAAVIEAARAAGFAALSLSVVRDDGVIAFFERLGFRSAGERGTAVTMRLPLDGPAGA